MVGFWLDTLRYDGRLALDGDVRCDLAVIGAGYTGLWTAIEALTRDPTIDVVVCEAEVVGSAASGRNGGFLDPSLTHGLVNGLRHFPHEIDTLERLAAENYREMLALFADHAVDCDFEPVGMLEVATREHELPGLEEWAKVHTEHGHRVELLDRDAVQARVRSPRFLAGVARPDAGGLLNPAKLARELARVAETLGARIVERTPVTAIVRGGAGRVRLRTPHGDVSADRVAVATDAFTARLLPRTARHYVPVYDYVLVSEPLTPAQRDAVGWAGREGVSDSGNRFHYFRLTADDRILWGGYDAVYHPGNRVGPGFDGRERTFRTLERTFAATFPQLAGLRFPHRWGGAIATTSRFCATFGTAYDGRLAYALGYTGLGVGASRFGARVLHDLLLDRSSALLELDAVRRPPFAFPPEPLRSAVVAMTQRALAREDDTGHRGAWLRTLDRLGVGFDS